MNDPHHNSPAAVPDASPHGVPIPDSLEVTQGLPGVVVDMDPSAPIRYGFHICGLGLLVPANRTGEVMEEVTIYPIPYMPSWLPGLINHRGNIVPVFDLESILSDAETDRPERRVLVIGHGEAALGVLVSSLPKTVTLGSTARKLPSVPRALSPFVREGCCDSDGEVWLEIDLDGFVQAEGERLAARST